MVCWNELPRRSFHPVKHRTIVEDEINVPYGHQICDNSGTVMLDDGDMDRNTDGEQGSLSMVGGSNGLSARLKQVDSEGSPPMRNRVPSTGEDISPSLRPIGPYPVLLLKRRSKSGESTGTGL